MSMETSIPVIDHEIVCIICSDFVVGAVRTTCCRRIFCSGCITTWLERGTQGFHTCPNCRNRISGNNLVTDNSIEQRSESQIRSCPCREDFGCTYVGTRAQIDAHKESCRRQSYMRLIPAVMVDVTDGSDEERELAIVTISNVFINCADFHDLLIEAGVLRTLVPALATGTEVSSSSVLSALDKLAKDESYKRILIDNNVVPPLIELIDKASDQLLVSALLLLSKLAIFSPSHQTIIGNAGALAPLVKHLKSAHESGRHQAAGALWNVCGKHAVNQLRAAELGVFPPLIELMTARDIGFNVNAAGAIWNILATHDALNNAVVSNVEVLRIFVQQLSDGPTSEVTSFVFISLETLCTSTADNYPLVIGAGAVPYLIACCAGDENWADESRQKSASFVLSKLLTISAEVRAQLVDMGVISALMNLLKNDDDLRFESTKVHAAAALTELTRDNSASSGAAASSYGVILIAEHQVVSRLSEMLTAPESFAATGAGLTLLGALTEIDSSDIALRQVAADGAIIASLATALSSSQLCKLALNILVPLARDYEDSHDMIAVAGAVPVLEELLHSDEPAVSMAAATALRILVDTPSCREVMSEDVLAVIGL